MKTVSGVVLSSKPVSLSKAAKILSKFASADNGASPAYVHYLKRASQSFEEAVQVHKELRVFGPDRKSKKHRSSVCDEAEEAVNSMPKCYETVESKENGVAGRERHDLGLDDRRDEVMELRKKKKTRDESGRKDNGVEQSMQGISDTIDTGAGGKKSKGDYKKGKKDLIEDGRSNGAVVFSKDSFHAANGENNLKNEGIGTNKLSKKRKSKEIGADNVEVSDSAEWKRKNKKRKKGKSEVGN